MKQILVGALLAALLWGCGASPPASPPEQRDGAELTARAKTLMEQELDHGQAFAMLRDLIQAAPKRLSGSPGAADAVRFGVARMQAIGLQNVRAEPVMVPKWVRGPKEQGHVLSPREMELRVCALGNSEPTPAAGITAEVVEVKSFEELKAMGERARGRIVFFDRAMPRAMRRTFQAYGEAVPQRTSGASEAAAVGALAVLVRSLTTAIDEWPHTGMLEYREGVPRIPAMAVCTKDAEELSRLLKEGPVTVHLWQGCANEGEVESANVVGEIVGSEHPEQVVLLGGHLDAWDLGEGAHDDGAGCAHVLEAMRLLVATGFHPKRTIRGVLFMNEENGLRGARGYAERHRAELQAHTHVAAVETDAGGFAPEALTCSLRDQELDAMRVRFEPLRELGMAPLLEGGGGADISVLREHGTVLFGMGIAPHRYFDYHHSAQDVLAAVNERELELGAAALAYAASVLADR